ncbi:MAG: DUF503 domain-containing protein [Candidatus Omnitrophica bacterium]|nr:DUF503 domain-containing protein [Candidatus Omnitrophota bacterium]
MIIGLLTIRIHIPASNSLKVKRMATKSVKERLRNRFNVSVAEVGEHEKWQLADIAVCSVSGTKANVNSTLSMVLNFVDNFKQVDIVDHQIELL